MKKVSVLILMITFTFFISENSYASEMNFSDVKQTDWFYINLQELVQKEIISGYTNGTFGPDKTLRFEEFIKMLIVATEDKTIEQEKGQEWYQIYVDTALENNYITEQQKLLISQNIDRKIMAEIIYTVLSEKEDIKEYTTDELKYLSSKLTDVNETDIKILTVNAVGIISGYPDGTFNPDNTLKRSESVAVISRLINKDMRLPVEIDLTETIPINIENVDNLPKVDLSGLYDYPTLLGSTVKEENAYYDQYVDDYKKIVTDDYIDFMGLMHNRDYTTINENVIKYKKNLLYYLNGYKEYQGKEYSQLRDYSLSLEKEYDQASIDWIMSYDGWIDVFLDKWVQDTIDNKVKVQAEFYTNENLLHDADGLQAIRGVLRIKYDSHSKPSNIKEELDLVQREKQKYGQRILNLDESFYDIYMNYDEIPNFEVGKWYEIEMDIVVSSQSFVHGLDNKSDLNFKYIYPIAVREMQ